MERLRVPAGVRVGGRGIGGRFIAPESLPGLIADADDDGAERLLAILYESVDLASRAYDRAGEKYNDDPARYAQLRADAQRTYEAWLSIAERAEDLYPVERALDEFDDDRRGGGGGGGGGGGRGVEDYEDLYDDDLALEWEIGFDYDATGSGAPGSTSVRRRPTSDVDVNIRIRREDGRPITRREAATVLDEFRERVVYGEDNPVPPGYLMAAINWRRPESGSIGWRDSNAPETDIANFHNPMEHRTGVEGAWSINPAGGADSPVRMGSVKPRGRR